MVCDMNYKAYDIYLPSLSTKIYESKLKYVNLNYMEKKRIGSQSRG